MQSKLGEPLQFRVGLVINPGEKVEESCLFLSATDDSGPNLQEYFYHAQLAIKTAGEHQYVSISSPQPFDELFARVQLKINCPGVANISKILTLLPDLRISPPQVSIASLPSVNKQGRVEISLPNIETSPAPVTASGMPVAQKAEVSHRRPSGKRAIAHHPPIARRAHHEREAIFRLKLSGDPIDESRIGKISPEDRELLLAQQKLLDFDDQTAKFLELQHQVKQLQDQLGLIRLKLEKIELAAPGSERSGGTPAKPSAGIEPGDLDRMLLIGAGLLLAVLLLWRWLRYYSNTKSRQPAHPDAGFAEDQSAESASSGNIIHSVAPVPAKSVVSAEIKAPATSRTFSGTKKKEMVQPSSVAKTKEELAEDDSMLEEAELYAAHGHSDKAIEILHEIIAKNATYTEAWVLMMSILSSLGKAKEFEKAARDFFKHNPRSESWKMIQALGRTLDPRNPLYAGSNNLDIAARYLQQLALSGKRLVGDILVDMGVLSEQELKKSMADFDPKIHGRFGGYLVARKLITHAQLSEALVLQQGIGEEAVSGTRLTLQEMEDLLSGFDPVRDGSIGEFLLLHGVITPEQFEKVMELESLEAESDDHVSDADESPVAPEEDGSIDFFENAPTHDKLSRRLDALKVEKQEIPPHLMPSLPELDNDSESDKSDKPDD